MVIGLLKGSVSYHVFLCSFSNTTPGRFACLRKGLIGSVERINAKISAACILHNVIQRIHGAMDTLTIVARRARAERLADNELVRDNFIPEEDLSAVRAAIGANAWRNSLANSMFEQYQQVLQDRQELESAEQALLLRDLADANDMNNTIPSQQFFV